jgi:GNAT superfamily N-acetyltransferase
MITSINEFRQWLRESINHNIEVQSELDTPTGDIFSAFMDDEEIGFLILNPGIDEVQERLFNDQVLGYIGKYIAIATAEVEEDFQGQGVYHTLLHHAYRFYNNGIPGFRGVMSLPEDANGAERSDDAEGFWRTMMSKYPKNVYRVPCKKGSDYIYVYTEGRGLVERFSPLNEVRIPKGYFRIANAFMLPGQDGWDESFSSEQIIEIDPQNRNIRALYTVKHDGKVKKSWGRKNVNFLEFMKPEVYAVFKANSVRLSESEAEEFLPEESGEEFVTTVKRFNKKAEEVGLDPDDKIKVKTV